jgi:8-oxo-dGTP pyrophosphatase MutT (NUDIX family)
VTVLISAKVAAGRPHRTTGPEPRIAVETVPASSAVEALTEQLVQRREVVAVAVQWRGRIGLFRRSDAVAHDRGRWHCITGYLEPGSPPHRQALVELHEETGLRAADLDSFAACDVLTLPDGQGFVWTVHTFKAVTTRRRLELNDEHDAYRWVRPQAVERFSNRVSWLSSVLDATGALLGDRVPTGRLAAQVASTGRRSNGPSPKLTQEENSP